MHEYLTEAVVLSSEPNGDTDSRVSLYTERFGKLIAKAKSSRKITSKLAGHLQPGNCVSVRLVEKNGLQVVDALKQRRLAIALHDLHFLDQLVPEAEPDARLWQKLCGETFAWPEALGILGWDPAAARCEGCGAAEVAGFSIQSQEFFCKRCASRLPADAVFYIH